MPGREEYETGARHPTEKKHPDANDDFSQDAAGNIPPRPGIGNSESVADVNEKTRHSDGQAPACNATPNPSTQSDAGAGPALSKHSKDAHLDDVDEAGTTDQKPRWEGPPENRPRGYLPAEDDPSKDRDAAGENLKDPDRRSLDDAGKTRGGT